jgi:KaiC/GvpD/RAD55 family RecA-like ATPase
MVPNKVKSGIYGLNHLLHGGLNRHSVSVVIGASGAGKTTFATQFIRRGLEEGKECVFVSLDESKDQIIQEAISLGWEDIEDYINREKLFFIDASGKDFASFIKEDFPSFVNKWRGTDSRIAIDPLTPVIWSLKEKYEQRELLGLLFKLSKKIGTVVCTLEEHAPFGELIGEEIVTPMYLADTVIHLRYRRDASAVLNRNLQIIKSRNTRHSSLLHPYGIMKGLGIVVDISKYQYRIRHDPTDQLKQQILARSIDLPPVVKQKIVKVFSDINSMDTENIKLEDIIQTVVSEYEEHLQAPPE